MVFARRMIKDFEKLEVFIWLSLAMWTFLIIRCIIGCFRCAFRVHPRNHAEANACGCCGSKKVEVLENRDGWVVKKTTARDCCGNRSESTVREKQ